MKLNLSDEEIKMLWCAVEYTMHNDWAAENFLDVAINSDTLMEVSKKVSFLIKGRGINWEH